MRCPAAINQSVVIFLNTCAVPPTGRLMDLSNVWNPPASASTFEFLIKVVKVITWWFLFLISLHCKFVLKALGRPPHVFTQVWEWVDSWYAEIGTDRSSLCSLSSSLPQCKYLGATLSSTRTFTYWGRLRFGFEQLIVFIVNENVSLQEISTKKSYFHFQTQCTVLKS